MALAWYQLEDYQRSREACHQAMLVEPFNLMARHVLGCSLLEEGDPNEALRIFRETLKEKPDHMPSYIEIVRTRRIAGDFHWMHQALKVEVSNYDRQPLGGELDSRQMTLDRINVILEQFHETGPTSAAAILRSIDYTQDESLRFLLWETACDMVENHFSTDTSNALSSSGHNYSIDLGEAAACLGSAIPEPILTSGLNITEQDLQRAATERYPPAHDVLQHRQNLDKERNIARAYQALLLLAIAVKEEDTGRNLLNEWVANADTEMAYAARMGLAIQGDETATKELKKEARSRDKLDALKKLTATIKPLNEEMPRRLVKDENLRCKTCGRSSDKVSHMLTGGSVIICCDCVSDLWKNRNELIAPDNTICQVCYNTLFEAEGMFLFREVKICSECVQFSLGMQEREAVETYFSERFV